jgi:ribosomal protein S18 acetylase RimI-like enzyme
MKIQIASIDQNILTEMSKILSSSAGYDISIQDELDYFNPDQSIGWFLATDEDGNQLGFIRFFEMNEEWSLGEYFIDQSLKNRREVGEQLLANFNKNTSFPLGHRLRFDISCNDQMMNSILEERGFSQKKQTFKYFEMDISRYEEQEFKRVAVDDANSNQVAEVLSNLSPVESPEVLKWIKNDQVRIAIVDSNIVAAAQISYGEETIEIVRIATHPNFLRKGHAEKLIQEICKESLQKNMKKIYLKVDSEKIPAIHLYQKIGFIEIVDKTQFWHSRWF